MGWLEKFKDGGPGDKRLPVLALLIVTAVAVVWATGLWDTAQPTGQTETVQQAEQRELDKLEAALESKIAGTLTEMEGVGRVTVAVTLSSGPRLEFGVNETNSKTTQEETPKEGGKRVQTQTNDNTQMVLAGGQAGGGSQPVKIVELSPEISGVLVVAEGAKNPYVLERIQKSVQTLLGIPAGKVRVEPLSKGGAINGN